MADVEILKRWKTARWHFEQAHRLLPKDVIENRRKVAEADIAMLAEYQASLDNNELELALDQLEGLGTLNHCRGRFWRQLEKAAQAIGLPSRALILHRRFEDSLGT